MAGRQQPQGLVVRRNHRHDVPGDQATLIVAKPPAGGWFGEPPQAARPRPVPKAIHMAQ
ncbi:hypothetical protein PJK45_15080 [Mycobacterium kansasii]|uniref:Uncharacterized protein n=3 Tax=Mycobacterium kansasii TaxID=1768 RepID=A0A653EHX5_MYCKA|nr:hypothetical protein [Mycobacterium kansasii]AGZ54529.1 hypothetical protein MKAN_27790 [Mycobacterium kansasii ATCC 12478]EUA11064.1 hypothetical protein I545_5522 [Mycobacterium kansasii 662]KEP42107.1 hypothetical protein MKSMC1_26940 [Mycobacterium kansasii]UCA22842.1 hypothetical protein LA359_24685 [Mycobacterium kansasii]UGT84207.1 hypothetical protein LTS70_16715 [Mycobacterium kansasii]